MYSSSCLRSFVKFSVGLVLFYTFVIFSVVVVFVVITTRNNVQTRTTSQEYISSKRYKFVRVDPETKNTISGFSSIGRELDSNEFVSYEDSKGMLNLIKNSNEEGFLCDGYCYCDEERRIISSSTVLKKSISYLITALSSSIAIQLAKNYFDDECVKKLSEECSHDQIFSDVQSCKPVMETTGIEKVKRKYFEYFQKEFNENLQETNEVVYTGFKNDKNKGRKYECKGSCLANLERLGRIEIRPDEVSDVGEYEEYQNWGGGDVYHRRSFFEEGKAIDYYKVEQYCNEMKYRSIVELPAGYDPNDEDQMNVEEEMNWVAESGFTEEAKVLFTPQLQAFCEDTSKMKDLVGQNDELKSLGDYVGEEFSMCTGCTKVTMIVQQFITDNVPISDMECQRIE